MKRRILTLLFYFKRGENTHFQIFDLHAEFFWKFCIILYQGVSEYWFGTRVTLETGSEQLSGYIRVWVRKSFQGVSVYLFSTVIRVKTDTGSKQLSRWFWILVQFCYQGVSGECFGTVFLDTDPGLLSG